ncbi:hypothetical protein NEOLEDRAFT_1137867 [Neolentinus lepideus HHB14362 ss-1]|uniref:Uncharacterized protein n=1 Tax=Neolentinus lepideus HHB14362 ss-1 TaxID=1314782 RepID=A0A165QHD2_9AGAM|nr:hypothetical protein NEOLEDRAFT_1137867 [Neolentinus lepideus HHB14362 ss-1]
MVVQVLWSAVNAIIPKGYYWHVAISVLAIVIVHAFAQGRTTNRERDLHARVILVTDAELKGGFTPLGLTLLQALAQRGAHIIALSPEPVDSFQTETFIDLLRSTTSNEQIYAEECDLSSPESIRAFCTRFLTGQETRLDAILFAHEYQHVGSLFAAKSTAEALEHQRQSGSMATFLMTTLLLPVLLTAPVERDIRIINIVNPFYAAAVPVFSPSVTSPPSTSTLLREGWRALRQIVLTRHLQRVLDALPSGAQVPTTDESSTVPVVSDKAQRSNIVAVSVSPGISRADTIAGLLGAHVGSNRSTSGLILYMLLQPLLRLITKSPYAAMQSALHALFLPTPYKEHSSEAQLTEVLKPGALYSECAVVILRVPPLPEAEKEKLGLKVEAEAGKQGEVKDDGEMGGQDVGRVVWEGFEESLKRWEASVSLRDEKSGSVTPPSVDTPNT